MHLLKRVLLVTVMSLSFATPVYAGYGSIITDTEINPRGIPMYDGYTKPESWSTYTIDYSRFWNAEGELNGLGDFTNVKAKNSVSREFASDVLEGEGTSVIQRIADAHIEGGYWIAEGRLCVALPPGAIIDPEVYEPLIRSTWSNAEEYTYSDWWTRGTTVLPSMPGVFDRSVLGMHVDCLLEDGTVLPLIVTDTKALHTGVYRETTLCKDNLLEGYAQWRGNPATGEGSYIGIIEVATSDGYKILFESNKLDDLNLRNNKIVAFRCYGETKGRFS